MSYEVVRYTPSGTRFVWAGPFDRYGDAKDQADKDRHTAYSFALQVGGEALYEPIKIVVEERPDTNPQLPLEG